MTDPAVVLFGEQTAAVTTFQQDHLVVLLDTWMPGFTPSDALLWTKLRAATADLERRLRVVIGTAQVVPTGADTSGYVEGTRLIEEPGYDYSPDNFIGNQWGLFKVRHRPIIAIQAMRFAYPAQNSPMLDVPLDWIRPDKTAGTINLVPTSNMALMPVSAYVMSMMGGGRTVPLMLQVWYTTGIADPATTHPDLIDLAYKMAALRLLEDAYLPQSGSLSADGLSQSLSFAAKDYQERIDAGLEALRQSLHGIRLMVV